MLRRLLIAGAGGSIAPPGGGTGALTVGAITTITDDSKYNAWPTIIRLANSSLLLAYTKGDSHHQDLTGKAVGRISTDDGATWGAEFTIYDDPSLWVTVAAVSQVSTGRIFATLWRDNPASVGTLVAGLVYSDDNGATWSAFAALTTSYDLEEFCVSGVLELADSDLLLILNGRDSGTGSLEWDCFSLRSSDNGATWGSETMLRAYATDSRFYTESQGVVLPNGDVRVLHRTSAGTGNCYKQLSTDDGATWNAPSTAFAGYGQPNVVRGSTGTLVAVTRQNSDAACIAYSSIDDGVTWGSAVVIDATMTEMEYGAAVQLSLGSYLVVYGYQPSGATTNADIKQALLTETLA